MSSASPEPTPRRVDDVPVTSPPRIGDARLALTIAGVALGIGGAAVLLAVRAGSRPRLEATATDAGAGAAAPAAAAAPVACPGTWRGDGITVTVATAADPAAGASCGQLTLADAAPGLARCGAPLLACAPGDGTFTATFACVDAAAPGVTVAGTLTLSCAGDQATVTATLDGADPAHRSWMLAR
ncbi:MAG: hypothetical protein H6709_07565 [Kofleriaceae bacterium]|nr:hypothetical protein [Kofleriaceae bacterium]